MMTFKDLVRALKPAGGGIHVVSTGVDEMHALQSRIYGRETLAGIEEAWTQSLGGLHRAKGLILGVPSDTGAGFTRGANRAPGALRNHLLKQADHPIWSKHIMDIGDVYTVPHLLSDEMVSAAQKRRTEIAIYGDVDTEATRPVTPLGICRGALDYAYLQNPQVIPIVIGGDHSVGWPAFAAAFEHWERTRGRKIGLLHFDAHTDLLAERLGVKYCFATWAYHANELLARDGRLVQVGIRTSGHTQAHWESTLGVRQYWAQEAQSKGASQLADEITDRFTRLGVDALYVSNDIDGTDPRWAAATGTPEPGGLTPDLVSELTTILGSRFPLIGGDLVEVAPPLAGNVPGEPETTLQTAGRYLADLCTLARV
jgi:arginase family enzyme